MRINSVVAIICFTLTVFICQSQTIIPGGYVSGNWDQWGSPYYILDDITIHEDSMLYISGSTDIIFTDTAGLYVYGVLQTSEYSKGEVHFTAEVNTWEGIHVYENDQPGIDSIILDYCKISKGAAINGETDGGALWIQNRDKVRISYSQIGGNYAENKGGGIYIENSDIKITVSEVLQNATGDEPLESRGGGIYIKNSNPVLNGVLFYGNESIVGGGLFSSGSSVSMNYCGIQENSSDAGGAGLVFQDSGQVFIDYCSFFDNNSGGSGGAIAFLEGIIAEIDHTEFERNHAESNEYSAFGGAIFSSWFDNNISIRNCRFEDNIATNYGGAVFSGSNIQLINSLFHYNHALAPQLDGGGGALAIGTTDALMLNCTLWENYSPVGSSLYCEDGNLALINSILWDAFGQDPKVYLLSIDEPVEMLIDHSNLDGGTGSVYQSEGAVLKWASCNFDADPQFILPDTDFSLAWNSPCINSGRSDTLQLIIPIHDIEGNPRISGGEIDMGCYEYQGPIRILENAEYDDLLLYPNPATDHIALKNSSHIDMNGVLLIADLTGKILFQKHIQIPTHETYIQILERLKPGCYVLRFHSEQYSKSQKIIIR